MTDLLAKLGSSLAERWLALLVLPGVLWVAAAAAAHRVGQAHPFDARPLIDWVGRLAAQSAEHRTTWLAVAAAVAALAAAGAGLAARGLGTLLEGLWGAPGDRPPMAWVVAARRRRWIAAHESARRRIARSHDSNLTGLALARARAAAGRAQRRRLAAPAQPPGRPTRVAERFHAGAERARTLYGLDLNQAWPRLWSVLPDTLRADVTAAREAYASAGRLAGWGLMYAALAALWWPAAPAGAALVAVAAVRARTAAEVLADLIDTATDLHLADLAARLGVPTEARSPAEIGHAVTQRLTRPQPPAIPAPGGPTGA
ncbi:hypothetical protein [Kitasatospora sp. NPDC004531]